MPSISSIPATILMLCALMLAPSSGHADARVYSLSELDVVRQVVPDYPRQAARAGFDGWVQLEFTVSPQGTVEEARVVDSSSKIFHREALVALHGWQFKPVAVAGHPAPVRAQLRFTFQGD